MRQLDIQSGSATRRLSRFAGVIAAAAAIALPTEAGARVPAWTEPQELSPSGSAQSIAVDDAGETLAVWASYDRNSPLMANLGRLGGRFGKPFALTAPGGAGRAQVEMNPAGLAVVMWESRDEADCYQGSFCGSFLRVRIRRPGGRFGPEKTLARHVAWAKLALNDEGDILVGYGAAASPGPYQMYVASLRAGSQDWDHQRLSESAPDYATIFPQIALGDDGSAVATWADNQRSGSGVRATVRRGYGNFGPTTWLVRYRADGPGATAPTAAVDPAGRATVIWLSAGEPGGGSGDGPLTTRGWVVDRPRDGAWGDPYPLSPFSVAAPFLDVNRDGTELVYGNAPTGYSGQPLSPNFAAHSSLVGAFRPPGHGFEPAHTLVPGDAWGVLDLDALGNVVASWMAENGRGDQPLYAGFIPRSGTMDPPVKLAAVGSNPAIATNGGGGSALIYQDWGDGSIRVFATTRGADDLPPSVSVDPPESIAPDADSLIVDATCDEACGLATGLDLSASTARRRLPRRLVRGGTTARLHLRLNKATRSALRSRIRSGRKTVTLEVRARDAYGNRRLVRRVVRLRS